MKKPRQRHFPYQHPTFGTVKSPKSKRFWEDTVYFLWWSYLRRSIQYIETCTSLGKKGLIDLYKDFGDVRGDNFKEWWSDNSTGMHLFAEPQVLATIQLINKEEIREVFDNTLIFSVPLNLPKKFLVQRFVKLLSEHHKGQRGRQYAKESRAKYRFRGQPNIQGLKTALMVYDYIKEHPDKKLWQVGHILPQFKMELMVCEREGVVPSYHFKRIIEATVSRYKRKATNSIKNVEKGIFP